MNTARFVWTFAVTSLAWFLFALDRLVVVTALPQIRSDLDADLAAMEWTVNAYTLAVVVLLLTGAALGDRFGRRRMFVLGLAVFTAGSAVAGFASSVQVLIAARAVQGAGGAVFVPIALTLLTTATPPGRRGSVLGLWGGIGGLGAAIGPLLGGGLTGLVGWQWIFWLNVPIGMVLMTLARRQLSEGHGPHTALDLRGLTLAGVGLLSLGWGLVKVAGEGWTNAEILATMTVATAALTLFVRWEKRASAPMLPIRFFRNRAFAAANVASVFMYAALFGGLFLVSQLFQIGLGATPLEAGVRLLPMAVMPMLLAPIGGALSDRFGTRPLMVLGVGMVADGLAWLAASAGPDVAYGALVPGLVLTGAGSAFFFAPVAATVMGSVAPGEQGQASGAATSVRELGAVVGVAVLASVFSTRGDLGSSARFLTGVVPALWVAAAIGTAGVLAALTLPRRRDAAQVNPGAAMVTAPAATSQC